MYGILIVLAAIALLTGCKTKYVSVPEYHTQYMNKTDTLLQLDSILVHDSVSVVYQGDTITTFKFCYRDRYRYIYKNKTDTILVTDSVMVPHYIEKERKRKNADLVLWFFLALAIIGITGYVLDNRMKNG